MAGKVLVIKGADFSSVAVEKVTIIDPSAPTYRLTVTSADATMGTVTGGGMYTEGANVIIKATPNKMYKFVKWSDNNTNATRTITMGDSDLSLSATFEADLTITDSKLLFNKTSADGPARSALYYAFRDVEDFSIRIEVAADSPYKAALHLMRHSSSTIVNAYSNDRSNPSMMIYPSVKDSGWKTSNQNAEMTDSDTDVSDYDTSNGNCFEIVITNNASGEASAPTAAQINQYITITTSNLTLDYKS